MHTNEGPRGRNQISKKERYYLLILVLIMKTDKCGKVAINLSDFSEVLYI